MLLKTLGYIDLPGHRKEGGFDHAAVHLKSGRLYVAHTCNDSVEIIDTSRDVFEETVLDFPGVAGALVCNEQDLVFTSNRGEQSVSWFPVSSPERRVTIQIGGRPNGLAYAPRAKLLLAANVGKLEATNEASISFVDVAKSLWLGDVAVPSKTRWCIYDPITDRFFANLREPSSILVFDATDPLTQLGSHLLPGDGAHGLDLDGDYLFDACDSGDLYKVDKTSGEIVAEAKLAGVPDVIFASPNKGLVYVAIGDPGVIQSFALKDLSSRGEATTERGAHTFGFDSQRGKLYAFLPHSCRAQVLLEATE